MAIKKRGGRPPRKKTERLNIVLTEQEYLSCQRAAYVLDCSMSEVVREGVRRVVKQLKQQGRWDDVEGMDDGDEVNDGGADKE